MKNEKIIFKTREKIIFGIIFLFSFLLSLDNVQAQQFSIFNFDTTAFPTMKVMFSAKTAAGKDYNNITVDDFDVLEDGVSMDPTLSIDCSEIEGYPPLVVHFMLDASQSMGDDAGNGQTKLQWVKEGVTAFLDTIHLDPPSEIAALSFGGIIKQNSGWTDEDSLRRWLDKSLKTEFGSTDFGPPFVAHTPFSNGALFNLATRDPNLRRIAIFMSDGEPERPFTQTVVDSIIRVAKREKIQVYALFINSPINYEIDDICRMTGGKTYQVYHKYDMIKIFREIVGNIQNKKQCKLVWTAPFGCDEASRNRDIKIVFHRIPDSVQTSYIAPTTSIANVTVSATQLKFGKQSYGTTRQSLDLTADIADMTIIGFNLVPGNGKYSVDWNGKTLPFVIPKGQSHTIYIDYIENPATQSELTELHLQGNPCDPPVVDLIAPCGGTIVADVDFGDVAISTTKDRTIDCIYKNTTPIDITGDVQLSGTDAAEFEIVSGGGTFTLTPGNCLAVTVRFKPTTTPGNKTAKLEYNTDADCGPAETDLKGNAIQSQFPLPALDFGKRRVLSDSSAKYVIKNTTTAPVTVTAISLQNSGDLNFRLSGIPSLPQTLAPDETITLDVAFQPQTEGSLSNSININIENVTETLNGQLTGFGTLPKVDAADIDFGSVVVLATGNKQLVITNPSTTEDLSVYEVVMPNNPDFKFATGAVTDNFTVSMNNGTATVPIEFTPQSAGRKTIQLLIRCDATTGNPPYLFINTVEITGVGLGLDISPTSHNFGTVLTCGSAQQTFVINNTDGEEDITVNSITFTGPGANMFSVIPPQPTTIPVGETANIVVEFAPQAVGVYTADMQVNTSSGAAAISLTGIGSVVTVKPDIVAPKEKILPGQKYALNFSMNIPNLDGGLITQLGVKVSYYGKSFKYIDDNNVTLPSINGWTWNIDGTQSGTITIDGQGPAVNPPHNFDFKIILETYLADFSQSSIIVTPAFSGEMNCIAPVADTLPITINTCFTEGRLVLASDVQYYLNQVKPNPAGSSFSLDFGLGFEGNTKIEIYNSMGELVQTIENSYLKKGKHELHISTANLSNGVYFIKMESGPFAKVRKLVVNK
jgi:hypothetical protein